MERQTVFLVVLAVLAVKLRLSDAVMCYVCDHVAHPRDCDRVMECAAGETCHVTSYVQPDGHKYFTSSCLLSVSCPRSSTAIGRRDVSGCSQCCHTDYCNKDLCDVPSNITHGLRCLKCDSVEHPEDCGEVTECPIGQICLTEMKYSFGERRFELGCAPQNCQQVPTLTAMPCTQCCKDENCNRDLCHQQAEASTTTKRPTTASNVVHTTERGCLFKGHQYKTNEHWYDGCDQSCTCLDGHSGYVQCTDRCPTFSSLPTGCHLVKEQGDCCAKPDCLVPGTNHTSFYGCYQNDTVYHQDDIWRVGCDYECHCVDAYKGSYHCTSLCWSWNLPDVCTLNDPAPGKCCPTPSCPAYVIIKYPAGYMEN